MRSIPFVNVFDDALDMSPEQIEMWGLERMRRMLNETLNHPENAVDIDLTRAAANFSDEQLIQALIMAGIASLLGGYKGIHAIFYGLKAVSKGRVPTPFIERLRDIQTLGSGDEAIVIAPDYPFEEYLERCKKIMPTPMWDSRAGKAGASMLKKHFDARQVEIAEQFEQIYEHATTFEQNLNWRFINVPDAPRKDDNDLGDLLRGILGGLD